MAILNEYYNYAPNYAMLIIGILVFIPCAYSCIRTSVLLLDDVFDGNLKGIIRSVLIEILFLLCAIAALLGATHYSDPKYQIPIGKKQIEATFALGHPSAAILKKYNVVGLKDGNVYIMEEK